MSRPATAVRARLAAAVRRSPLAQGDTVLAAVSGGLDSVALLHLLRFEPALEGVRLAAAHFDHAMRDGSAADAEWVRGLCRAWGLELRSARADVPLHTDGDARVARYAFLEETRSAVGARLLATAHTADDQAETVLLRVARGTGPDGLSGIAELRAPGVWRPLLDTGRAELEAYVTAVRLAWREDPTNADPRHPRNVVRSRVLPELERTVAPGARAALVRLAAHVRDDRAAWDAALPLVLERLGAEPAGDGMSLDRDALLTLPEPLQRRVLRSLAARAGCHPGYARCADAIDFARRGRSGARFDLGDGVELARDFERLVIGPAHRPSGDDRPVRIGGPAAGSATARVGGAAYRVRWGTASPEAGAASFSLAELTFPLEVRGWAAGDRIALPGGTRKLKKLFGERRIARRDRDRVPVLVDGAGAVLWVRGLARARVPDDRCPYAGAFHLEIADADAD